MRRDPNRLPLPTTAAQVAQMARENDLVFTTFWGKNRDGNPYYRVSMARRPTNGRTYLHAWVTWHKDPMTGTLKLDTKAYRPGPQAPWRDIKDLKALAELISETPVRAKPGPKVEAPAGTLVEV